MTLENYDFSSFNDVTMEATKKAWLDDANAGLAFPSETERLLDWAHDHREPSDQDATAYGIFRKGKHPAAMGICEVIIRQQSVRSKWVKMLRLHLSPAVDASLQGGDPDAAMEVFTAAIKGSIALQLTHRATTLKVFGRTNEQLRFLKVLVNHLRDTLEKVPHNRIKATIDGRFLSIVLTTAPGAPS